jgi:hypothetical protein
MYNLRVNSLYSINIDHFGSDFDILVQPCLLCIARLPDPLLDGCYLHSVRSHDVELRQHETDW